MSRAHAFGEAFLKLRPFDPARWGLSSRDRLGPRDDHPLRAALDDTVRVFGLDRYELYLHQKRDAGVQAIFGPGTNLVNAAADVLTLLGHNLPPEEEAAE